MASLLFQALAELAPVATWVAVFVAAIIAVFTVYVGVAMLAALFATDERQAKLRYRVFRDLLLLFARKGR
ncbi:hypothetical protein [Sphaerisporangium krabiense]|uniref:Uncharacterized protein n=2 Tax=Sphaerisporangium krabiense TaxID=763782 RepID=A0A7W9DU24_9ACTN|nr:hypothetical protein [Sphaerisporangium krabiense]MBB5631492.1 hypothetical protein [Sphaerisporangium krabiense]